MSEKLTIKKLWTMTSDVEGRFGEIAERLGLWMDSNSCWCVVDALGRNTFWMERDVMLLLRLEGLLSKARDDEKLSEVERFRLYCLLDRRLESRQAGHERLRNSPVGVVAGVVVPVTDQMNGEAQGLKAQGNDAGNVRRIKPDLDRRMTAVMSGVRVSKKMAKRIK